MISVADGDVELGAGDRDRPGEVRGEEDAVVPRRGPASMQRLAQAAGAGVVRGW